MSGFYKKNRLSSVQIIVLFYVGTVWIATFLLWMPVFHRPGAELSLLDALFTASSAVSVTGLTVVPVHEVFNPLGIVLMTLLFQIGGIGVMAIGTFFWLLFRQRIGLEQRKWIAADHNRSTLAGLVGMMKRILMFAVVVELLGTIVLACYFWANGYHDSWSSAFYYGFFAAISAFTNAGFDLYGISLQHLANDYFFLSMQMVLIVSGTIGFPVLLECFHWIENRMKRRKLGPHPFSLNTKIAVLTFVLLLFFGAVFFYWFERELFLADKSWHERLFYSLFQSVSSRSAGLTTMDLGEVSGPTVLLLSLLMFIGASPNSMGGGIRTTTLFVLFAAVFAYMRGQKSVKVFGRELAEEDIFRSFLVFFVAIALVFSAVLLIVALEGQPLPYVMFEVCSAFGTTGSSMGITASLGAGGKTVLIVMMVIGRIGILNLLLLVKKEEAPANFHYPKERVIVGQ